jgi:DNA topoisomerase-2
VQQFITPIVKATKKTGAGRGSAVLRRQFYSAAEYAQWQRDTPDYRTWHTKYYKGLGTSDSSEAKECVTGLAGRFLFCICVSSLGA